MLRTTKDKVNCLSVSAQGERTGKVFIFYEAKYLESLTKESQVFEATESVICNEHGT